MQEQYDHLVIGSGIAGLSYAIKVANRDPEARIAIITKSDEDESNTKYAQGGVAVVMDIWKDSHQKHIDDTIKAGDGLCDPEIVELVITEAKDRLIELIEWGVQFDKEKGGEFALGLEGGHTENRILHHKDITGLEIEMKLLQYIESKDQIDLFPHHFAIDLITEHHLPGQLAPNEKGKRCYGAYVLDCKENKVLRFASKNTLLATGGLGQIYRNTTNPLIATGDGIGMAYRAGAQIKHLEFIQFHPTALDAPDTNPSFLISEAVRGFGAYLRNEKGVRFMLEEHEKAELAPRDVVSRCIDKELKRSGEGHVWLDCRHLNLNEFKEEFPTINEKLSNLGLNLQKDMIPVVPAAHYLCGGIAVDKDGRTSMENLYAVGEVSCTGLHGGNRLASNSLLEALVFSHRACIHSIHSTKNTELPEIPLWNDEGVVKPKEGILITHNRKELQELVSDYVGIVRSEYRLKGALKRLAIMYEETEALYKRVLLSPEILELRNMISSAYLIVQLSLARKVNQGGFYKEE